MLTRKETSGVAREVVVLTGSSGCVGHATLRLLIGKDNRVREVRCLDLVVPNELMKRRIEEDLAEFRRGSGEPKLVEFIEGDIRDINTVEQALAGADCVIHCAAKTDIWTEVEDQDVAELESINVGGTENLLKACVRLGVSKFIHVSSFEVFTSFHTIYYATENTLPEPNILLFGPSALSKKEAENKVRQYANNKLHWLTGQSVASDDCKRQARDSLNAVIIRFTPVYGEHDKYFVSKILEISKFFGGKLQRFTNVWIRQQPIYVGNAAWALIKAKQRMDWDENISDFHITDETAIGDLFDFVEPFLECKGMLVTKRTLPALPIWFLMLMFFWLRRFLSSLDILRLFTNKKDRLQEQIERDQMRSCADGPEKKSSSRKTTGGSDKSSQKSRRWYDLITPQTFFFMVNSLFFNRTKASLRLDYEPLFDPKTSYERSIDWYKNHLKV